MEYAEEIKNIASDNPNIIFTGFVQGKILEELYSNAYIYVLPSDLEGKPLSLLEAMSYGNCCVTSDIPECSSVMGEYGLTFKKGDTEDLRMVLCDLLSKPQIVKNYKSKSADYICEKYNWDDVTDRTIELYLK